MTTVDLSWKLRAQKAEAEIARLAGERDHVRGLLTTETQNAIGQCDARIAAEKSANLLRERVTALEKALTRMLRHFADEDDGLCIECGEVTGKGRGCDTCYVLAEAEALLHPEAQSLTLDKVADPEEKGTTR